MDQTFPVECLSYPFSYGSIVAEFWVIALVEKATITISNTASIKFNMEKFRSSRNSETYKENQELLIKDLSAFLPRIRNQLDQLENLLLSYNFRDATSLSGLVRELDSTTELSTTFSIFLRDAKSFESTSRDSGDWPNNTSNWSAR